MNGKRRIAICVNCEKERPHCGRGMCSPCYVRWRYLNGTPVECQRCTQVRLPFSKGMCKSCYQITRKRPDASIRGSEEHRARVSAGQAHGPNRREKSGKWKGGRFVNQDGYAFILPPDDYQGPRVQGGRYVSEHRYVAEQMIGRRLRRGEIVHHRNHVRDDNRPENLQVLPSVSAHRRLHIEEERRERLHQESLRNSQLSFA